MIGNWFIALYTYVIITQYTRTKRTHKKKPGKQSTTEKNLDLNDRRSREYLIIVIIGWLYMLSQSPILLSQVISRA